MKKLFNFKGHYSYKPTGKHEKNDEVSQAVPDMSFNVRDMLQRYVNGIMPNVGKTPQYESEDPQFDDEVAMRSPDFDLVDATEMKQKLEEKIAFKKQEMRLKKLAEEKARAARLIELEELAKKEGSGEKTGGSADITAKAKNDTRE